MPARKDPLVALISEVRRAFQDLGAYGTALHEGVGVNASMRAVMEFIDANGSATAPDMARAKNVSRQHIQTVADQLIDAGLAEARNNPRHKRSSLIALTRAGKRIFASMKKREELALAALAEHLRNADLERATQTLRALRVAIADERNNGEDQ